MPSTDAPETPPDGESFGTRLANGWERAMDDLPLAVVPLVSSLLAADNIRRVRAAEGVNFGITFPFPPALTDLWTFVNVPSGGPGVHVSPGLAFLPVRILVEAVLVAGLLGSVGALLRTGRYDFADAARRYFAPMLGYVALVHLVTLSTVVFTVVSPLLLVFLLPVLLVLKYLFYATAYLVVVADESLGDALARSYRWATAGGPYFSYAAGFLLFAALLSVVTSAVVVNLGVLGVVVGAVATAPVALALTFATTEFVADLDARERGESGGFGGDDGGVGGGGRGGHDRFEPADEFDTATDRFDPTDDDPASDDLTDDLTGDGPDDEPPGDFWDRRKEGEAEGDDRRSSDEWTNADDPRTPDDTEDEGGR
ncbi:hypothetical protein M0R88_16805 [Halorussus gelatinilyticus]|uniref:DUF4013 domain-containing protein n=1 Tax=Halorussus gelatinilyticus TaxID=2937524 RepID=A0A8U0IGF7_9EURY|nr:hypothetical protein [Halorussus gelatinilyticus]UPW00160.1 hypothetical protein M0R88_16805 [Halorussus gelatinilyticus]